MCAFAPLSAACCALCRCLPMCGFVSGNRARLARAADSGVLHPTRRIHIRRRGRVLHNSPPPASVRPAAAPTVTALGTLGNWANGACVRLSLRGKARLLPRAASTVRSAILRRRNTASLSRARPLAHHANCRRAVPLRSLLTHAPLAQPSAMVRFSSKFLRSPMFHRLA